ncbi:hypothetical protein ACFE04_021166 [Oxalis oulophora]
MGEPRFRRPNLENGGLATSPNLFVANCGPGVGVSHEAISRVFSKFGEVKGVYAADESGARVIVSFSDNDSAKAAIDSLHARPCDDLLGRTLHIRYSIRNTCTFDNIKVKDCVSVSLTAEEINIPGLFMLHDFVDVNEERDLLAAVDSMPWYGLAKRRVQHYGYEFRYDTRNVDPKQHLGELPSFVSHIIKRIASSFPNIYNAANLDQLTVNEYPSGVGLSPHIDTHSAFEDLIFSLSLAGPCIMEFRKYSNTDMKAKDSDNSSNFLRKAIYLPPRSIALLSGEARYAWHHYIPHHKIDNVQDTLIRRGSRRVSFTLRKASSRNDGFWLEVVLATVNFPGTVILRNKGGEFFVVTEDVTKHMTQFLQYLKSRYTLMKVELDQP